MITVTWFQRDAPDVNSHRVFDEHQPARRDSRQPVQVTLEKPPKLDIIEINGSPEQYPFFIAQVREARQVHSVIKILAHLKTRLKGKTFDAVRASLLSGCTLVDVLCPWKTFWKSERCCSDSDEETFQPAAN